MYCHCLLSLLPSTDKPSFELLQHVLYSIEGFMFAFAEVEGDTPEFLHRPVDAEALEVCMHRQVWV